MCIQTLVWCSTFLLVNGQTGHTLKSFENVMNNIYECLDYLVDFTGKLRFKVVTLVLTSRRHLSYCILYWSVIYDMCNRNEVLIFILTLTRSSTLPCFQYIFSRRTMPSVCQTDSPSALVFCQNIDKMFDIIVKIVLF